MIEIDSAAQNERRIALRASCCQQAHQAPWRNPGRREAVIIHVAHVAEILARAPATHTTPNQH